MFLGLIGVFYVVGAYLGGMVFLKLAKLPEDLLSPTILIDYKAQYWHVAQAKKLLKIGFAINGFVTVLPVILGIMVVISGRGKRELHGSARFANRAEIVKAKLFKQYDKSKTPSEPDILIGKIGDEFMKWSGNEFVLMAAPTRTGKGVGFVIPNLLHYPDSVVVFDPKLENFQFTSGFREKYGQEVFLFSPDNMQFRSHRWNPLFYIRRANEYRTGDVLAIAQMLYPSNGDKADATTQFFNNLAQNLFMGLVLYMIDTEHMEEHADRPTSLATLLALSTPRNKTLQEWVKDTIQEHQDLDMPLSNECENALLSFSNIASDNTSSGVLTTLQNVLNPFRDPLCAAATNGNDFDIRDLRRKRMTVYIAVQPANIEKFSGLLNLFFAQILNENTRVLPKDDTTLKYQLLMLMDEFTSLGRLGIVQKSIAYIAGYNVRLCIILQDLSQLYTAYTEQGARTLISNFACQIIYTPNGAKESQEYSELLGYETVKSKSRSKTRGKSASQSDSESDQRRALMLPQELREMEGTLEIVKLSRMKMIKAEKIEYWTDPVFAGRFTLPVAPVPKLKAFGGYIVETAKQITIDFNEPKLEHADELLSSVYMNLLGDSDDVEFQADLAKSMAKRFDKSDLRFIRKFS